MKILKRICMGVVGVIVWGGVTFGVSYAAVSLYGGGPAGPEGPEGPRGLQGPRGRQAEFAPLLGEDSTFYRLAQLSAAEFVGRNFPDLEPAASLPQIDACIDYIVNGTGSGADCGFRRR